METSEHTEITFRTSDAIDAIAAALAKAQCVMKHPAKNKTATVVMKSGGKYTYKYADLADTLDAVRKCLNDQGISVVQIPSTGRGFVKLTTLFTHASGQYILGSLVMPSDTSRPQDIGSTITYCRRYALTAMAGVMSEDDNDANLAESEIKSFAVGNKQPQQPKQQPQQAPQQAAAANKPPQIFDKDKPNMVQWMTSHLKENNITDSGIISSVISLMHGVEVSRKNISDAVDEVMTQIQMRK